MTAVLSCGDADTAVALVEAYTKAQGLFRTDDTPDPVFTDWLELDLSTVEPSLAGPRRPQDRVPLAKAAQMYRESLAADLAKLGANDAAATQKAATTAVSASPQLSTAVIPDSEAEVADGVKVAYKGESFTLRHGA
ncbi:MAG TPA: aconitase family protein, partial [Gemmatimonadaceae bacterium]|nr:aconitase family protein [Gemmatimonadaceae bacterium]